MAIHVCQDSVITCCHFLLVIFRFDLVTNIRHLGCELLFYRNGNTNYTLLALNLPRGAG